MQRKESLIEVKVGALVLLAVAVLTGMVLILGDCNFSKGFEIYVDFDNAAGLKPGAPVRIAGIPAGNVREVEFLGGEYDPDVDRPVYVRATVWLEESARSSVRQDAEFAITQQSVLGEPYVEITSMDVDAEPVRNGQKFRGDDPTRLDTLMETASNSLEGIEELVERLNERGPEGQEIRIDDFINNIADLAGSLDERVEENKEEIDNIVANVDGIIEENRDTIPAILSNVEGASGEFDQLGRSLNRGIGNGSSLRSTLDNVEQVTEVAAREADPLLTNAREMTESANRIITGNEAAINTTLENVEGISDNINSASEDVETMVARIEAGEGSIGRLLRDEEIFEDMREFVRELKRRPWRIIWKE